MVANGMCIYFSSEVNCLKSTSMAVNDETNDGNSKHHFKTDKEPGPGVEATVDAENRAHRCNKYRYY